MPLQFSSPLFSSTIRFVDERTFRRATQGATFVDEYDDQNIKTNPQTYTHNIVMCNAGGITTGREGTMFHFQPWADTKKNLKRLEKWLAHHTKQSPQTRGLLVGGHSSDSRSMGIQNMLCQLFSKFKIPFSVFNGHPHDPKNPADSQRSDIAYNAANDEWLIHAYWYDGQRTQESINTPADIKKAYQSIYIDQGDVVEINIKCNPLYLNQK